MHLYLLHIIFVKERHSKDLHNDECAQETAAVMSILQTFDQVNKNILLIYLLCFSDMLVTASWYESCALRIAFVRSLNFS